MNFLKLKLLTSFCLGLFLLMSVSKSENTARYSLTIKAYNLNNSKGVVQFTLYNKDGSIPDEHFKKFYKQGKSKIINKTSTYTFKNLPIGKYAVNIHHDENKDSKIDKGWILPVEGIGFSNFEDIGFTNRPNFKKASFNLTKNTTKRIKIIYM